MPYKIADANAPKIFAKAKPISPAKAQLLEEIKEAIENLNLVIQGKLRARPPKDLLNEL